LIINERNIDELNAMDRQCPWLPFILVGVKWQQASEEDGGKGPRSEVRGRRSGQKKRKAGKRKTKVTDRPKYEAKTREETKGHNVNKIWARGQGILRRLDCPKERTGEFCSRESRIAGKSIAFHLAAPGDGYTSDLRPPGLRRSCPGGGRFELPAGSRRRL